MNLSALSLPLFAVLLLAAPLIAGEAVNGTTVLLDIEKAPYERTLHFDGRKLPVMNHPVHSGRSIALVPVNYRLEPGRHIIEVRSAIQSEVRFLDVVKGEYPAEAIKVEASKVTPPKKSTTRIAQEFHEATAVYETFTPERFWSGPFVYPMQSAITSAFGNARTYNGKLKSFHSGTDFKAAVGTPVAAVNDGVVVIARDRYYAGNSVVIDHGEGLFSCYFHLSRMDVEPGERVQRGHQIGLSGKTGRVTGPHLHFAVMLHGVQVDPLQLLDTLNTLFEAVPEHMQPAVEKM